MKKILLLSVVIILSTLPSQEVTYKRQMIAPEYQAIYAMREERLMGHISFSIYDKVDWLKTRKDCWLKSIEVRPAYRKQGVGSHLFHEMIQDMQKQGCTSMQFVVQPCTDSHLSKEDTIKFYEKNGAILIDSPKAKYPRMAKRID